MAYVAIRVVKVKGYGQLTFTTQPCTHWAFSFHEVSHGTLPWDVGVTHCHVTLPWDVGVTHCPLQEPELVLEVESTFEGRSFHRLSSFIESKVRRWVRQKHTLPAHKTRQVNCDGWPCHS